MLLINLHFNDGIIAAESDLLDLVSACSNKTGQYKLLRQFLLYFDDSNQTQVILIDCCLIIKNYIQFKIS